MLKNSVAPSPLAKKRAIPEIEPLPRTKRRRTMIELPISPAFKTQHRAVDDISLRHVTNTIIKSTPTKSDEVRITENDQNIPHQKTSNAITK